MRPRSINRREFVKTAGAAVAAGIAGRAVSRARAQDAASRARVIGANDRIQIGMIGVGTMGGGHLRSLVRQAAHPQLNEKVVAVCDIFSKRLDYAKNHAQCEPYTDYRKLLENKDVDAVVIATPDHWHARMAVDALNAGKHAYLEKPMTYTAEEAIDVRDTVERTGRIMQVGSHHCSEDCYWLARDAIAARRIGKVVWAQDSFSRNSRDGEWNFKIDPDGTESTIDWKAFLGPRPERPFDPQRFFRWRKFWDYSGGIATDLFFHKLAPLMVAIGPSFPTRVVAVGGIWVQKDGRESPDTLMLSADFPGEWTVNLVASLANAVGVETLIRGVHGTMKLEEQTGVNLKAEEPWKDEFKAANADLLECQVPPRHTENAYFAHMADFLACIRNGKAPHCSAQLAAAAMVTVAAGVRAYREQRTVSCDPQTGKLT